MAKKLAVDVWSDIACPWCYVGKRRFESALSMFPHRASVQLTWRSFELDPAAPPVRDSSQSYSARLARKYGSSVEQASQRIRNLSDLASAEGLAFDFERIRPGNTFNAHRLLHLALERGVQPALKERFLRGYMTEGVAIGDPDSLLSMSADAGLDVDEARALLSTDTFAAEVRADERQAHELGVDGVPFFKVGERYGVAGAQPAELLLQALNRAWDELPEPLERLDSADGQACGPDGCG